MLDNDFCFGRNLFFCLDRYFHNLFDYLFNRNFLYDFDRFLNNFFHWNLFNYRNLDFLDDFDRNFLQDFLDHFHWFFNNSIYRNRDLPDYFSWNFFYYFDRNLFDNLFYLSVLCMSVKFCGIDARRRVWVVHRS